MYFRYLYVYVFISLQRPFHYPLAVVSAVPAESSPSLDRRYAMLGGGEHIQLWAYIDLQIQ